VRACRCCAKHAGCSSNRGSTGEILPDQLVRLAYGNTPEIGVRLAHTSLAFVPTDPAIAYLPSSFVLKQTWLYLLYRDTGNIVRFQTPYSIRKYLWDRDQLRSGKEVVLPPPPPLRTVLGTFVTYGSSLYSAPCGAWFHNR
jgi:hypothetical protein